MINLLPQYWQKKLKEEEVFKTILILGIVVVLAILSFVLMLLLAKFFYSSSMESLEIDVAEKEREMAIFNIEAEEKKIAEAGKSITMIGDFYGRQTRITELFYEVSKAKSVGVDFDSFGYGLDVITVKGTAASRDALVAFKNNLEADDGFRKVAFPQSNWLKARDIEFSVMIELPAKQQAKN